MNERRPGGETCGRRSFASGSPQRVYGMLSPTTVTPAVDREVVARVRGADGDVGETARHVSQVHGLDAAAGLRDMDVIQRHIQDAIPGRNAVFLVQTGASSRIEARPGAIQRSPVLQLVLGA
jgi:hypothetical protein